MGWTVPGSNPGGFEIFRTRTDQPWAHPASNKMGTGSLLGLALTTHSHLAPRLKNEYSYTSTPPLGLHDLF
jgi:hypothetical protein